MQFGFHTLDVFTTERFGGNPLAVVLNAVGLETGQMQQIAAEFNLSETVFVLPPEDEANTAKVRIFTPVNELAFAGHPTVGTAILLAHAIGGDDVDVRLEEGVGLVPVKVTRDGNGLFAQLGAAVMPKQLDTVKGDEAVAAALSLKVGQIGFGSHRPSIFDPGNHPMLFVPVENRATLKEATSSMADWSGLGEDGGILVYAYCAGEADEGVDFHARAFAPTMGIAEDPATGSAAVGFAGPLFAFELPWENTASWMISQGEDMGRPSRISLEADVLDGALSAIRVGGHAVMVTEGTLTV